MISVIIPVYNNKDTIRDAVNSVLSQEGVDLEIVCVDDGSADGTDQVLAQLAEESSAVRVIRQENAGPGAARNRGIEEAKGEYITFVDSDDVYKPGALSKLLKGIDGVNMAIAGIEWRRTFADGRTSVYGPIEELKKYAGIQDIPQKALELFEAGLLNNMPAKIYRRELIEKYQVRVPLELDMGEDLQFALRYLRHIDRVMIIPEYIYVYETDNSTLSTRYRTDMFDQRKLSVHMLRDYLQSQGLDENIVFFLYEKLLVAQTMQDIEFHRPRGERKQHILAALSTPEIAESIDKLRPKGKMQKAIGFVVGTKCVWLITFFSRLSSVIRSLASDKIKKVSV